MQATKRDLLELFKDLKNEYETCGKEINDYVKQLNRKDVGKINFVNDIRIIDQQIKNAQDKFTIATIGEFKAGKSTTLNTLLNLRGDKGLSCQFQPDTAKAIRILQKPDDQEYEAEIVFYEESGLPSEYMTWSEAKKYTSQVELDENPSLKRKAEQIDEVRYYVNADILEKCNFLDLPGTGFASKHNQVTQKKINECDAVFWIMSNTEEVNNETIKNLQMIKHKIIPIINVWYNSDDGEETGDFTFEEMKDNLLENYKAYLGSNEILKYCAKAIDIALDAIADNEDPEDAFEDNIDDTWGYNAMKECLHDLIYGEGVDLEYEKKSRMIGNVVDACSAMNQKILGITDAVGEIKKEIEENNEKNLSIKRKIGEAYAENRLEIKEIAGSVVDEILGQVTEASELFIDDKMSTAKIMVALKSITHKDKLADDYRSEFIEKYLEIQDDKSSWLQAKTNGYIEDLNTVFTSSYIKAGLDMKEDIDLSTDNIKLDLKFFDSIGQQMQISFERQIKDNLPSLVSGVLLAIPGNTLADAMMLLASLVGKKMGKNEGGNNTLEKRVVQAKRRAKLSISFQRAKLTDVYKRLGSKYNEAYKKELEKILEIRTTSEEELKKVIEGIHDVKQNIMEFFELCNGELENVNGGE